jgi:uncharacterized phiE125 gp8 family phage protein
LSDFPTDGIVLPVSPVTAVTTVKYYDSAGVLQTVSASDYYYSLYEEPTVIRFKDTPPTVNDYKVEAVEVAFTAGYANANAVPKKIRQAILVKMGDYYTVRNDAPRERFTQWQMACYSDRVIHTPGENQ